MKKTWIRCIFLLLTGLFSAGILYPSLHEAGHGAAALLLGGRVEELSLFPEAFVRCFLPGFRPWQTAAVALSGMLFPLLCSLLIPRRGLYLSYLRLVLQGVCLWSFLLSGLTLLAGGSPTDDARFLLPVFPGKRIGLFLFFTALSALLLVRILRKRPVSHLLSYFFP